MVYAGCVFVAGIHLSRTWMPGSFEFVRWNACVLRLDLGLYSHPKEFWGNGIRNHAKSQGKNPLYWKTSPQKRIEPMTLHHAGQWAQHTTNELFWPVAAMQMLTLLWTPKWTCWGGWNSSLVVFGLAVHSVAGSILLWGNFPVEGIFPLELTWVQTPFPKKTLSDESVNRGLVCAHMHFIARTQKILTFMS